MVIYRKKGNVYILNVGDLDKAIDIKTDEKKFNNLYNFFKYKKNNNEIYDYVFIDTNSIFLFPVLKKAGIGAAEDVPFKIIGSILNIYKVIGSPYRSKFILSIDNGISNILKNITAYKDNRPHSIKKEYKSFSKNSKNMFNRTIGFILDLLPLIGCKVDILKGETDFKIGYYIKTLRTKNPDLKILTISSDLDYLGMAEYSDVLIKRRSKNNEGFFLYIRMGDTNFGNLLDKDIKLFSPIQYYFFKALIGDSIDNIKRLISNKKAVKIINTYNEKYNEEEIYDINNFLKFCEDYVDPVELGKNLYSCFPFNENTFDNKEEIVMLDLLIDEIQKNQEHKIELLLEKISMLNYGGKDFIHNFKNKIMSLYGKL